MIFLLTPSVPRLIGGVGIADRGSNSELGYWVVPSHWGRGYATEAARAVVAAARYSLPIDRLVSGHFTDNPASGAVLRKLGFVASGEELRDCRAAGVAKPCRTYALELTPAPVFALAA